MARLRVLSSLAVLLTASSAASAGAMLEPHVAAYRLSLADRAQTSNPFVEVRGGLVIEWRLACDGFGRAVDWFPLVHLGLIRAHVHSG